MSSGIAAPIGGRILRARTLGHESAREHERRRLRRHLRVTTLRALEDMAATEAATERGTLLGMADEAATELRAFVLSLAAGESRTAIAELRCQVGAMLHDCTLQSLEYLAADAYGAELTPGAIRQIADDAAVELRGELLRIGAAAPCELVAGLQQVVAAARERGAADIELIVTLQGRVYGADAAALVGAAREAITNAHKHAQASSIVVRCDTAPDGARVSVSDDGIGADMDTVEFGIGLRHSIIERMAAHGGRADIASAPGEGTLVTLTSGDVMEVAA
jgi:signal transduction histidine kinase